MGIDKDTIWERFLSPVVRLLIDEEALRRYSESVDWERECDRIQRADVVTPTYYSSQNFHGIKGGYLTTSAAVTYDPITQYVLPPNESWVRQALIDAVKVKPRRILDLGCGTGSTTLMLKKAFPDAEVIGLDLGAPMVRYAHARAVSLGIENVRFVQGDAQFTDFADEGFDWIQTTMFLHETSHKAMFGIVKEIYRMLQNGGISLHIEQPQYTPQMSHFEQFMRDWDAFNNNEPFWGAMHEVDVKDWMHSAGFRYEDMLQFGAAGINDHEDFTKPKPKEQEDYGRSAVWNVFGSWKK